MPGGYIGYNQATDVGNAFGGIGDALGSAILRGAIMRQQQQDRQQQLMIEIERLRQEQENARSLNEYRGKEIDLRKKEGEREDTKVGFMRQKADEGAAEIAMRRRFAGSMRGVGVPQPPGGIGPSSPDEERQADAQESAAYLSNEPKNALDTILKMQAMQSQPMNPVLAQQILSGFGLHNIPPGNVAVPPGGGAPVATGMSRAQAGQDLSMNTALTELVKMIQTEGGYQNRTNNPIAVQLEPIVRQGLIRALGTNAPPATTSQPITAINPQTKQRIVSYDNGQTWQPAQ